MNLVELPDFCFVLINDCFDKFEYIVYSHRSCIKSSLQRFIYHVKMNSVGVFVQFRNFIRFIFLKFNQINNMYVFYIACLLKLI